MTTAYHTPQTSLSMLAVLLQLSQGSALVAAPATTSEATAAAEGRVATLRSRAEQAA